MIDDQAPNDKETSTKDVHVHISQLEEDSDIRTSLMQGLGKFQPFWIQDNQTPV